MVKKIPKCHNSIFVPLCSTQLRDKASMILELVNVCLGLWKQKISSAIPDSNTI